MKKAKIRFVGYEVELDNYVWGAKTLKKAKVLKKKMEEEAKRKFEEENNKEKERLKINERTTILLKCYVKDLVSEAQQAGKNGDKNRVEMIRNQRMRLENLIERAEQQAKR